MLISKLHLEEPMTKKHIFIKLVVNLTIFSLKVSGSQIYKKQMGFVKYNRYIMLPYSFWPKVPFNCYFCKNV